MYESDQFQAPEHLTPEAAEWWERIQQEYSISDNGGRLLLTTAMEAFDRMKSASKVIAEEGATIKDRFDQVKSHPLLTVERDARAAMVTALKSLNLDLEPLKKIGRPTK